MLDFFGVFLKGGLVLWSQQQVPLRHSPVTHLIQNVLLEEKLGQQQCQHHEYTIKWTLANKQDLIFVVVYQRMLGLNYVDNLLARCRDEFVKEKARFLTKENRNKIPKFMDKFDFGATFDKLLREAEASSLRPAHSSSSAAAAIGGGDDGINDDGESREGGEGQRSSSAAAADSVTSPSPQKLTKLERLKTMQQQQKGSGKKSNRSSPSNNNNDNAGSGKKKKTKRAWDDSKVSAEEMADLDVATKSGRQETSIEEYLDQQAALLKGQRTNLNFDDDDEDDDDDDNDDENGASTSGSSGNRVWSFFSKLTGNKELEASDLDEPLAQLKNHLVAKNVALEIADKLCESVKQTLVGQQTSSFSSITQLVRQSMEQAMTRILTPKRHIDVLRDVQVHRQQQPNDPFVVVFVGVNGVGKSTSLAKVCAWLQQNQLSVLIAACDTFRSGAVEQLRVHARCLDVPLFDRGYNKDAASVAADAVRKARADHIDVVLVDTAGRMQDNAPLMRSLTKLVALNRPNLILFVGEALVGNESVSQLTGFNAAMTDYATTGPGQAPRTIDGIVLTKFDTVDEKVGAAVSMVYTTGQPIIFVGTGQHYTDLKKLNTKQIIKTLLR